MAWQLTALTFPPDLGNMTSLVKDQIRINQAIRAPELRIIDEAEGNLGVMSRDEALAKAEERGLDLIEIAPTAIPPVAKIMDFGKYQYLENKKGKESKKAHGGETKSLQVKIGTGTHDLELKARQASKFLAEGNRVKVNLFLPGRAKYLDPKFLEERLERLLQLLTEEYKIADPARRGPKGLSIIIERSK